MDKKINFLHTCREAAAEAEKLFGMNARIILAQGALESGWGTSMLATEHHNFFGLMGYGASNAYWHGQRATFETATARTISGITKPHTSLSSTSPA